MGGCLQSAEEYSAVMTAHDHASHMGCAGSILSRNIFPKILQQWNAGELGSAERVSLYIDITRSIVTHCPDRDRVIAFG